MDYLSAKDVKYDSSKSKDVKHADEHPDSRASATGTDDSGNVMIENDEPELMDSPVSSPPVTFDPPLKKSSPSRRTPPPRLTQTSSFGGQSAVSGISSQPFSSSATSPQLRPKASSSSGGGGDGGEGRKRSTAGSRSGGRNSSFEYRETLDATTQHLADGSRIINQYKLGKMIGQGAYGSVYRACLLDDPTCEFAIKEFGKTRLRKTHRAQTMRKGGPGRANPNGAVRRGGHTIKGSGVSQALEKMSHLSLDGEQKGQSDSTHAKQDPLSLIRQEIAILKKLHHPHLVRLYEVLDDPSQDELYMVFEYCPDGRVIDVKLHEQVDPLDAETARKYFVQIMLGIEYLHHHDIVHRDIKPDNILLQDDHHTCKIVDFGVSEFFIKPGDDTLQRSAGSPAFMSPELCSAGRGDFHGKDSDMWSMGVTFYSMVVGRLPFDKSQFLELYESIKSDEPDYPSHLSEDCKDLLKRLLEKEPSKRITISEMRKHPFINKNGEEEVLKYEENIKDVVEDVTAEELDSAINKIASVFTLARAISRFKRAGSRASSAGSIGEITSSLLSKGKDVAHHAAAPISRAENDSKGKEESADHEKDEEEDRNRDNSQASDSPGLEHMAQAHVVLGASNSEWAASHIARALFKRHRHASSESSSSSSAKAQADTIREEGDDDVENEDDNDSREKDDVDSEQPKKPIEKTRKKELPASDELNTLQADSEKALEEVDRRLKSDKGAPKVLPDQPTVASPPSDFIATPQGASDAYRGKR